MKTLTKISFVLVLLAASFNSGLSNAYAEGLKAAETNNIESVDVAPLKCSIQLLSNITLLLNSKEQTSFQFLTGPLHCTPQTSRVGNTVYVVRSDCYIDSYKIDPNKQ